MAEPLKNIYNQSFLERFAEAMAEVVEAFDRESFLSGIFDADWEDRALKERMRHISVTLQNHLPKDFEANAHTFLELIPVLKEHGFKNDNLEFIFLPDFIELYGRQHLETAVKAFEVITQFVTCEFAVRPFIIEHPEEMLKQMLLWSQHTHASVRRLASEGCRPRLPWAMAIPMLKRDPSPILPILEQLKDDPSEYVRRSVANNLNDIAKDRPEVVIEIAKRWKGRSKETDWVVKHASRTLLKQGNTELMVLFGFGEVDQIKLSEFEIHTPTVKIGERLEFSFDLENTSEDESKIRLEYGVYYQKANGALSRKVFKISEKEYAASSITSIVRKQPFKVITTRKFHLGKHQVSIIINGKEFDKLDFELVASA